MKFLKYNLLLLTIISLAFAFSSCKNKSSNASKTEQTQKQGKEYTSAYICPMHCDGSGSDVPGSCPVCGMDYEKNEK